MNYTYFFEWPGETCIKYDSAIWQKFKPYSTVLCPIICTNLQDQISKAGRINAEMAKILKAF